MFPYNIHPENEHEKWMVEALKEAWKAFQAKEVPIGAVLVKEGKIISRGHNQVEMLKDATAHAEMLAMTAGANALENWRLLDTTLYVTVEPCAMCAGALLLSRVTQVVWGAPDIRHGAGGSWVDLFSINHPMHQVAVVKGVLEPYAAELLKTFFTKRRHEIKDR